MAVDALERQGVIVDSETQVRMLGDVMAHVGEALVKRAVMVGVDVRLSDRQLVPRGPAGHSVWLANELREDQAWEESFRLKAEASGRTAFATARYEFGDSTRGPTHMFLGEDQGGQPALHVRRTGSGHTLVYDGATPISGSLTDAVVKQAQRTIGRIDMVHAVPRPLEATGGLGTTSREPARLLVRPSGLMPLFGEITGIAGELIADTKQQPHTYVDARLSYCLGQLGGVYESPNQFNDRHVIELNVDNPHAQKGAQLTVTAEGGRDVAWLTAELLETDRNVPGIPQVRRSVLAAQRNSQLRVEYYEGLLGGELAFAGAHDAKPSVLQDAARKLVRLAANN